MSTPVLVDLQQLLAARITDIQELSLTAAQYKAQQKKPRQWKAGAVMSAEEAADPSSASFSTSASITAGWGQKVWQQLQAQSRCSAVGTPRNLAAPSQVQQQSRKLQRRYRQQQQQQDGPYNIWDHSSGDAGSTVELFPQEIRTWLITMEHA